MATDLGKVGMRARGDWNNSDTYEVLDVVSYNNSLYIAKQAVPANTTPTNTTYWQVAFSATNITTPTVLSYQTISTDTSLGDVTFRKYSNGVKSVSFSKNNLTQNTYTTATGFIPSEYMPNVNYVGFGSSWSNGYPRRINLITDGRVSISASNPAESGIFATFCYM